MFYVFSHYVVPFGTMAGQLVRMVTLEDVRTCQSEINYYLKLACMSCKMKG